MADGHVMLDHHVSYIYKSRTVHGGRLHTDIFDETAEYWPAFALQTCDSTPSNHTNNLCITLTACNRPTSTQCSHAVSCKNTRRTTECNIRLNQMPNVGLLWGVRNRK